MTSSLCQYNLSCSAFQPIYPDGTAYDWLQREKTQNADVYKLWDEISDHNEIWEKCCE